MTDEEAIKALSCEVAGRADCEFQLAGMDCSQCIDAVWESARSALRERIERKNGGWISVKDGLPEDDLPKNSTRLNIKVLTTVSKNGRNSIRTLCRERWITGVNPTVYHDWIWAKDAQNITHWMPLPQPPKEDANGA